MIMSISWLLEVTSLYISLADTIGTVLTKSGASRAVRPVTRVTSAPRSMQAFAMLYPIFPEE